MDTNTGKRFYRKVFNGEDLVYFSKKIKQTDLCIGATHNLSLQAGASIEKYRQQVEQYIRKQPVFLDSLEPVKPLDDAPLIVKHMCQASALVGVGPMAAIAGAISLYVATDLKKYSKELIVENGGDIYISGKKERTIGIYAGDSTLSGKLGIKLEPQQLPISVCTSSGTVGHSLSFGKADAVVILSRDACLADAAATAIGNMVKRVSDIDLALNKAQGIEEIVGVVIIIEDQMGVWGQVKLVRV